MKNHELYQELKALLQSVLSSSMVTMTLAGNSPNEIDAQEWHINRARIHADLCRGLTLCYDVEEHTGLTDSNAELAQIFADLLEVLIRV
jgi:hypothetical protein